MRCEAPSMNPALILDAIARDRMSRLVFDAGSALFNDTRSVFTTAAKLYDILRDRVPLRRTIYIVANLH